MNMKEFFFFCVNYHSYQYLRGFLLSLNEATSCVSNVRVIVCVGDNSEREFQELNPTDYSHIQMKWYPYHQNLGYLGCALKMMEEIGYERLAKAQYVTISNVDLKLSTNFIEVLSRVGLPNIGWLAPDIYTPRLDEHDNPYLINRPSTSSFKRWKFKYSHPLIYIFTRKLYYLRRRKKTSPTNITPIYSGHGSLMVFSGEFISNHKHLTFPSFMYGEEIFFSELILRDGLKVFYYPELRVENVGRVSTGTQGAKWICLQSKKSLSVLQKMFF